MPNDTLKTTVDLSKMYDLSQPGKYTVRVARVDNDQNTFQSNPVEFTVVSDPNYVPEIPCTVSGDLIVTVSDPSGAYMPNALVVVRPEANGKESPRPVQVTTSGAGTARAQGVSCGFVDVFVAADGFIPYSHKMYMEQPVAPLKVTLQTWPGPL